MKICKRRENTVKQFKKVLKFELKDYFTDKVFIGITVVLIVALAAVMFFPRISALFKSDEPDSEDPSDRAVMLVSGDNAEELAGALSGVFGSYKVEASKLSINEIKEKISEGDVECALVFKSPTEYTYYVKNLSISDSNAAIAAETIREIYRMNAMIEGGLSSDKVGEIMSAEIKHTTENLGKDQIQNFFYTYVMIFALYMVILFYGQMVASSVATEKSSRAMELLITSADPVSMMFGKVIASCLAGLIQLSAVFGSALLFYNLNKGYWDEGGIISSLFNIPAGLLVFMLLFFILGFFVYAFMYGAVGSTVSKLEDISAAVMPITLIFVAGFVVVMTALGDGSVDSLLMRICSFIPFTSPMAMFTRIAMSTVPTYEIAISIVILVLSVGVIGYLAAKIYRIGVLLYGTPPKPREIIKALRKS